MQFHLTKTPATVFNEFKKETKRQAELSKLYNKLMQSHLTKTSATVFNKFKEITKEKLRFPSCIRCIMITYQNWGKNIWSRLIVFKNF